MAPTLYDEKPEPGDLIEIDRGNYQHWAVYIGDGFVVHLAPPSEGQGAGSSSMMSVMHDKAKVKKEELWDVVGTDKWCIKNSLDEKCDPRPVHLILKEAKEMVGAELPFCVFRGNCEHFATELRYGKAESRQVQTAVQVGVGLGVAAVVGFGIAALASAIFSGGKKEKSNK
ncbi:phospholipase A and acyltransferase 4-like [Osmerus mordax]|uniref:Retinoic acid receptor responder protein 3 n=1 Tax=Osmerus mordax TaxID=8014 RepID=C1BJ33_OSMMO|nr:Retinoic acid receptor responder protein 3 [Osmerus mordax]